MGPTVATHCTSEMLCSMIFREESEFESQNRPKQLGKYLIRINTICPTFIRTPLTESTFEDQDKIDWVKQKIKLNRVGEVEDILGGIIFLASDASSLMTGSSLLIDGGWTVG